MSAPLITTTEPTEKNARGIPKAPFIADVEAHIGGPDGDVEAALRRVQDALAKYRYMDANLQQRRRGLADKIPDIRSTLAMVTFLEERREAKSEDKDELEDEGEGAKPLKTTFELADTLYAEAEIPPDTDTVYLWLGANVMLSYPLPAASTLLEQKIATAVTSLAGVEDDIEFVREQITVMEVNTARLYNWDVKRRRERRIAEENTRSVKDLE